LLLIHILNVGHGDSIILEYRATRSSAFAVIDSNCSINEIPRALHKLQELNAESLSFIAITHPHADHYMGMGKIMDAYVDQIDNLYTFPVEKDRNRLKKLAEAYVHTINSTDSETVINQSYELIYILKLAQKIPCWETPSGTINRIIAPGFEDVEIHTILPPARVKGDFFQKITSDKAQPEDPKQNDLSLAFLIKYQGHNIVLGGDGTYNNWIYQSKRLSHIKANLNAIAAKLPHHGSKHDCQDQVLQMIYGEVKPTEKLPIACISANGGVHHPHSSVLKSLAEKKIKPYCTNLAKQCGNNIKNLPLAPQLDPTLLRYINTVADDSNSARQPCQGDITICINDQGEFSISTQYENSCALRGDYDFLSSSSLS
jgi:beta-lactamase superfamily II metal-dependent hydrolase